MKASKDGVAAIANELDHAETSVKNFSGYLAELETRRDGMEAETVRNLEQAFGGFLKNAEETLRHGNGLWSPYY